MRKWAQNVKREAATAWDGGRQESTRKRAATIVIFKCLFHKLQDKTAVTYHDSNITYKRKLTAQMHFRYVTGDRDRRFDTEQNGGKDNCSSAPTPKINI